MLDGRHVELDEQVDKTTVRLPRDGRIGPLNKLAVGPSTADKDVMADRLQRTGQLASCSQRSARWARTRPRGWSSVSRAKRKTRESCETGSIETSVVFFHRVFCRKTGSIVLGPSSTAAPDDAGWMSEPMW